MPLAMEGSALKTALTAQQVDNFNRDGCLFPIPMLCPQEITRYRSAVEELEERAGGPLKASRLSQPQLHYAWAYELATHPALLDTIECLLGPNILVHSASIFSKGPKAGDCVDWHQDGAYWDLSTPMVVSAWIALTDSTAENGCMRMLPGSHTQGVVPFTVSPDAPKRMLRSGLRVTEQIDESTAVDVVLRSGEASLHHVNTIHGSTGNHSQKKRIGFAIRYVPPHAHQRAPTNEVLLARGRDDHHHYTLKRNPPTATIEQGLAAHIEYSRAMFEIKLRSRLEQ